MRAALEGRAAHPAAPARIAPARLPARFPLIVVSSLVALVGAAVLAGDGSGDGSLTWVGSAALVVAAGCVAGSLAGAVPWPRLDRTAALAVALFAAFVAWNAVTVVWSIAPDRSWSYFNRGVVYFAFLVAGLFAAALVRRAPTVVAAALAVIAAAACAWALAGKVHPALFPDGARIARLREPVGFWNALALVLVLALPVCLWLAAHARAAVRVASVVLFYSLTIGILLTYSRGGVLVAVFAVAAWLAVGRARLEALAAVLCATPFAVAVSVWAFGQPGIAADGQPYATRAADGREFALALTLGAAGAAGAALLAFRFGLAARLMLPRRVVVAAAAVVIAAGAVAVVAVAGPASWLERQAAEFNDPEAQFVPQDPSRLTSASSNNRLEWWRQAWEIFRREPLLGSGAGTFGVAQKLVRRNNVTVTEPHNEVLQFLSETGLVGALLAVGGATAGLVAVAASLRRLPERERGAATALVIGFVAYLLHSLIDWDWDFLAVNAPVFAAVGVVLAAGRPLARSSRVQWGRVAVVVLVLVVLLSSLLAPWLADARVDSAYGALARGGADEALASADTARSLNPLALEPLYVTADAQIVRGDLEAARRSLVQAVELQPLNPEPWYELGRFELEVAGRADVARRYLERARELDPYGPAAAALASAGS